MQISRLKLRNWKNFTEIDVNLSNRVFIVGPNACGKSNLLDVFRFLKKIANTGFKEAIKERGSVSKIRSLAARKISNIEVDVSIISDEENTEKPDWRYLISFNQDNLRNPKLKKELVWRNEDLILERPDEEDKKDEARLYQTALQQINANKDFRDVADFFKKIQYIHLVPQLIRKPGVYAPREPIAGDPFGSDFLGQLAETQQRIREPRLKKIQEVLRIAVPNLESLDLKPDERGVPHLVGAYKGWRAYPTEQNEEQFSDGTLRLIGLLWALIEGEGPLLLEEPELSLHAGFVKKLAPLMYRLQRLRKVKRQILVSTHSFELLSDEGIDAKEVLLLYPNKEGTMVQVAADDEAIRSLLKTGMTPAEVVIPKTKPENLEQLDLFR
jgi:predicted ATPase